MKVKIVVASCRLTICLCLVATTLAQARRFQVFTKEDYDDVYYEEESSSLEQNTNQETSNSKVPTLITIKKLGNVSQESTTSNPQAGTFAITIPVASNGTAVGKTIEIKIPMTLMNMTKSVHNSFQMSTDNQRLKNIEAALMQVLQSELKLATESSVKVNTGPMTTPKTTSNSVPSSPIGLITEAIMNDIRNGMLPQLLVRSVEYLERSVGSYDIIVDVVECVIFFSCDPDAAYSNRHN